MAGLHARTVFANQRFEVVVVESVELRHGSTGHGHHLTACLKPVAVAVKESDKTYAVDMEAKPVSIDIDQLRQPPNDVL
ncbi:MAG: hypothetical protein OEN22_02370 [Gammaproteobacteria bacterium]|nr:hypothetical protein [Gammaproteobacteria bacterium]